MEDTASEPEAQPNSVVIHNSFVDLLKSYVGKVVTIVNPESYEDAPLGHQIRAGWYRAKPIGVGKDYVIVATEYVHTRKQTNVEPVKQYIPIHRIKRVSVLHNEVLIHI